MPNLNDRIGSQNVIRVLSNASAAPTRLTNLTDVDSTLKTQDGMILVWDLSSESFVMTDTIDSSSFVATGIVTFSNTTNSSSTTDGALVVSGGVGIVKNLNVGGDANIAGIVTFGTGAITVNGNTNVISIGSSITLSAVDGITAPSASITGGLGVGGTITGSGNLTIDGTTTLAAVSGVVTTGNDLYAGNNLYVANDLTVSGESEFVGIATFRGGIVKLGDDPTDDIDIGGEFISNLVPNTDNTYDLGISTQRWRDGKFAGLVTSTTLNVAGVSTLSGIVTTGSNLNVGGELYVTGPAQLDNVDIIGVATIRTLRVSQEVTGLTTFTGIATFTQNVFVDGTLTAGLIDGGEY